MTHDDPANFYARVASLIETDERREKQELEQAEIDKINSMSHIEMCQLWRFAPVGHKYFDGSKPFYEVFKKRLAEFGGFTPAISKHIGW